MRLKRLLAEREFNELVAKCQVVKFRQGKIVELENRLEHKRYIVRGDRGEGKIEVEEVKA